VKKTIPAVLIAGALAFAACGSSGGNPTSALGSGSSGTSAASGSTSASSSTSGATVKLTEAGSTLMYPYLQTIAGPFHSANSSITLQPGPGGSGEGLSDAASGTTDFGASDAYLSPSDMTQYPTLVNIPMVVSSQAVDYNLKGIKNLKLSGSVLAQIYQGKITKWNDSAITSLNPGVNLPNETIHPIHRSDSSGDSFLFTSFLSATSPPWASAIGPNELPNWPSVSAAGSAEGNPGMAQACKSTAGCVAYIGISEEKAALQMGLGEASLQNKSGKFVQSSSSTVDSAVSNSISKIPSNLAVSLIYAAGADSYPIVNFEYALVKKSQSSSSKASALKTLFDWIVSPSGGSSPTYLAANQFQALPSAVVPKVKAAISSIS